MEKRQLGTRGPEVSALAMGCWAFGGGAYWGPQAQDDVDRVVRAALDRGVTLFDTAEVYNAGASETSLGQALRGRRDEAVVVSKAGPHHATPNELRAACEASLSRLGTDRIDVYMFHWPIEPRSIAHFTSDGNLLAHPPAVEDAFATMEALREEGKIRYMGVSNFGRLQLSRAAELADVVVDELPYNLLARAIEPAILPACVERGIGVLGYMGLQQGLLTGSYTSADDVPAPQAHSRHFAHARGGEFSRHEEAGAEEVTFTAIRELAAVAAELGLTLPALSIAWLLHQPGLSSTLIGSRTVEQLDQNLAATEIRLEPDALARLDAITRPVLDALGTSPDYYENRTRSRVA